jgi:GT2 family glycosyltransferase
MPYAGGTAALYQTAVLRQLSARTTVYDPFYWEDVEWGFAAAQAGLTCWLAPKSLVRHLRRATVNKVYEAAEVERVFERNRLLFQLRRLGPTGDSLAMVQAMSRAPWRTLWELFRRT